MERGSWALSGFAGLLPGNPPAGRLKGVSIRKWVWAPLAESPEPDGKRDSAESFAAVGPKRPRRLFVPEPSRLPRRQVVLHPRHLALGGNAGAPDASLLPE